MTTHEIRTDAARAVAGGLAMLAWNPIDNATVVRDVARRTHLIAEADATAILLDSISATTRSLEHLFRTTADQVESVDLLADPASLTLSLTSITGAARRLKGFLGDDVDAFSSTDAFNAAMLGATADPPGVGSGVVDAVGGFLLGDLANVWNGGGDALPVGQLIAGGVRVGRTTAWLADPGRSPSTIPLFNNGGVGVRLSSLLQRSSRLAPVGRWMQGPAGTAFFRRAGVVGGVYGTVTGGWELVQHGNPVDAYREHGAGYVADVAGTAFSASTTLFLLAPTPATAAAVVVTGVVWAGAEVWDHRDDIMEWTSEQWDRVVDGAGAAWDLGTSAVSTSAGAISDTASSAWDTGTDVVGAVGSAIDPRSWF
ncbi:MAG: hypothetical protein AAF945_18955 [Actinomycetota bacterium]